jgi:hypothetical protein
VANQLGYDWRSGVQIGGLLGDIAGTGHAALTRSGSLRYALKAMAPELIGGGVGFAYGYNRTGTFQGAIEYAGYGVMLGGITSAVFIKCFVAGTPVAVPTEFLPVTAATQAGLAALRTTGWEFSSRASTEVDPSRLMAATSTLLIGLAGWSLGQMYLNRQRRNAENDKRQYTTAADWLFEHLAWD